MRRLPVLGLTHRDFPPIEQALKEPNGLLAAGGDLSVERLLQAYRQGIFPWFDDDQPILWWSPDPRAVLFPDQLHISRSLRKTLRSGCFQITADTAFDAVIAACAEPRPGSRGTWITADIRAAYGEMHRRSYAHSVECWYGDELVGGVYGIALGNLFFGESMFSRQSDASKTAFVYLVEHLKRQGCPLIDCQIMNPHLARLGATLIPRDRFKSVLCQGVPSLPELLAQPRRPWSLLTDDFHF